MAGSPIVAAGRPTPVVHPSVLPRRDEVMKVRHPGGSHDGSAPISEANGRRDVPWVLEGRDPGSKPAGLGRHQLRSAVHGARLVRYLSGSYPSSVLRGLRVDDGYDPDRLVRYLSGSYPSSTLNPLRTDAVAPALAATLAP